MNTLLAYFKLFPLVLGAVKSLEEHIPLPGKGKEKLDLLVSVATDAFNAEENVREELGKGFTADRLVGIITTIAGTVVSILKRTGVFK